MLDTATILTALAALGFQWGFQPADDGTLEYIIQLSPQEAQHLAASPGVEFTSYLPKEAQPIGRIRIAVGEGTLPRDGSPPNRLARNSSARPLDDPSVDSAAAEEEVPITETQARITRSSPGRDGEGSEGRGPLGDEERNAADELDGDLAGRLVAVPALPGEERVAELPEGLRLTAQNGSPLQSEGEEPPHAEQRSASSSEPSSAADPPRSQLPEGVTQPVYTTGRPSQATVNSPAFDSAEFDADAHAEPPEAEISPSDRPVDRDEAQGAPSQPSETEEDRPWLPLVGAIALACGFLAGNVFQWRSYMSLRKRYLRLLRKTGG